MSNRIDHQPVRAAVQMALAQRRPSGELLHHSDQGRQYSAEAYQATFAEQGISVSTSGKGNCYDNAVVESSSAR
jgi:transposase InsO family protein